MYLLFAILFGDVDNTPLENAVDTLFKFLKVAGKFEDIILTVIDKILL